MSEKIGKYKIGKYEQQKYLDLSTNVVLDSTQTINPGGDLITGTTVSASGVAGAGLLNKGTTLIGGGQDADESPVDLSSVSADHKVFVTGDYTGSIKLPQATSTNAGMLINVMVASNMSGSIGFADSGDTVFDSGQVTLIAQADTVSTGIVSVGNGKRILIESLSGSAPGFTGANLVGGAEGSQFKCHYTEANKVVLDAFSRISNTAQNAALTSSFTSSTGL